MKKAILMLLMAVSALAVNAQCTSNPNIGNGLYPSGDSLPCALVGQAYSFTFQFRNLDSTSIIAPLGLDSLIIDSIVISGGWNVVSIQTDKPNNRFLPSESGCISFNAIAPPNASRDHLQIYASAHLPILGAIALPLEGSMNVFGTPVNNYDSIAPIYINTISAGGLCQTSYISQSNYLKGKIYYDTDGNGSFGTNDYPMANTPLTLQPNNSIFNTNSNGFYYAFMDTGAYNVALTAPANYAISSTPLSYSGNFTVVGDSAVGLDFGLIPTDTIYDLSVTATSSPTRPGFNSYQWIVFENRGTLPIPAGTISYTLDTNYTLTFAIPGYDLLSGHTYTWNFAGLLPNEQRTILLSLYLPPNIDLMGDTLVNTGTINPNNEGDGTFVNPTVVTASYDPNDKTPYPTDKLDEAFIDSGDPLRYRIRFQNTGTDTAFNITVRDTLDLDKFDVNSIRLLGASHEHTFRIEQGNIAIWEFPNILLPDSNINEPGSHGFIMLELNLLPGLGDGDQVLNRAGIYFDFNPVVLTEYAISRVDFSTGLLNTAFNKNFITLYPNPAQNRLVINHNQWQQGSSIVLYDLSGKVMLTEKLDGKTTEISTANLPNGMYLYQVLGASGIEGLGKVVIAK